MDRSHDGQGDTVLRFGSFVLSAGERQLTEGGRPIRLGGRAFDLLLILVANAGHIVSKEKLLSELWPGVMVDEVNLRVHLTALRKALGDGIGDRRFIINVPGRGYRFVGTLAGAPPAASPRIEPPPETQRRPPAPRPRAGRTHRVFGRGEAVSMLVAELHRHRFVSVVGPGGIGKTTIALAVADVLSLEVEDAVTIVDLAPIGGSDQVVNAVATSLGLPVRSSDETAAVLAELRKQPRLIVLDNCEHVVDGVAALAEMAHRSAQGLYILATSREPLRATGEHVYRLPPLASPPEDGEATAAAMAGFPAVELFVERAASQGEFQLTDANAGKVGEICRRLDGLALAIELAAARVNAYGVDELAVRLDDRFRLLNRGFRTALPRHQTLRMTLDWSYDLLSATEQTVLRRLGIFAGSFSLEAAEAVAADEIAAEDFSDTLADLIAKSLVATELGGREARYRLLETTRVYALERLTEGEGRTGALRRMAVQYADALAGHTRDNPSASMGAFRPDVDNIRTALTWGFSESGDAQAGVALVAAAAPLFFELSLLVECTRWTSLALDQLGPEGRGSRVEMELSTSFAMPLLFTRGNLDEVKVAIEKALELSERLGDASYQARTLDGLFVYHLRGGHFREMFRVARQTEALLRNAPAASHVGAEWMMAIATYFAGEHEAARAYLERSMATLPRKRRADFLRIGVDQRVNVLNAYARTLWMQDEQARANEIAALNIEESEERGDPVALSVALMWTLPIALWNGDLDLAEERLRKLVDCVEKNALLPSRMVAEGFRGILAIHRDDPGTGIPLIAACLEGLEKVNSMLLAVVMQTHLAEGLSQAGKHAEAIGMVDKALTRADQSGDLVNMPNLHRLKAEILTAGGKSRDVIRPVLADGLRWAERQHAHAHARLITKRLQELA